MGDVGPRHEAFLGLCFLSSTVCLYSEHGHPLIPIPAQPVTLTQVSLCQGFASMTAVHKGQDVGLAL